MPLCNLSAPLWPCGLPGVLRQCVLTANGCRTRGVAVETLFYPRGHSAQSVILISVCFLRPRRGGKSKSLETYEFRLRAKALCSLTVGRSQGPKEFHLSPDIIPYKGLDESPHAISLYNSRHIEHKKKWINLFDPEKSHISMLRDYNGERIQISLPPLWVQQQRGPLHMMTDGRGRARTGTVKEMNPGLREMPGKIWKRPPSRSLDAAFPTVLHTPGGAAA